MNGHQKDSCFECQVRGGSLFCDLNDEDLHILNRHKTCQVYKKGQTVFHEDMQPYGLFALKGGKVKIHKSSFNGREQIIRLVKPGDIFGYRSFLAEEKYRASATTLEDSKVCYIDRKDFLEVMDQNQKLTLDLLGVLTKDLRHAEDKVHNLIQKSVKERIAEAILILKDKYGQENESTFINAQMSREDLANFVGTTTETLIRILSELKKDGFIEVKGRQIKILDPESLVETANVDY